MGCQSLQHLARTPTDLRLRVAQHVHEQVQGSCFPEDPGEGPDAGIGTEHVCVVKGMVEAVTFGKRRTVWIFEGVKLNGGVPSWKLYGGVMNEA